jgi:hypothetical protein
MYKYKNELLGNTIGMPVLSSSLALSYKNV